MHLVLLLGLSLVASLLVSAGWLVMARYFNWFDIPNQRSSHSIPTPKSGGGGFVLIFTLFTLYCYLQNLVPLSVLEIMLVGVFLAGVGFVDDLRGLGIRFRLISQLLTIVLSLLILDGNLFLTIGPYSISGIFLFPLVLVAMLWLVNLYNFMDGIDGLAATQAIYYCLALAWLSGSQSSPMISLLALGLAASISGFLYLNMPAARLFMGDLGSNYLGFILGMLGLLAIVQQVCSFWTIAILLGTFVADSTTTLIGRMLSGAVWYHGHRTHAYQQVSMRHGGAGRGHLRVVGYNALINIFWLLPLAWVSVEWPMWALPVAVVALFPLVLLVKYLRAGTTELITPVL